MPPKDLPYPLFDADNHLYETAEALTKYLPAKYKDAIKYVEVDGRTKIAIRGQISEYIPNPTFSVVARPGSMEEYFKNGNPEGKSRREIFGKSMKAIPAFSEPGPRLELMDELGVDRTLMFPTLASLVEERMRDDPDLIHAVVHALNEWLYETWQFNYKDRIFTTPVISLPILDKALEELEWVAERGARAILVRPAPVPGFKGPRSFAMPEFDPFWKRVVELDLLVAMHSSDSGYARFDAEWEGTDGEMLPFQTNTFRMVNEWRPVQDTVASWVCHGALFRFPDLKLAVIESGSAWLRPLLDSLADTFKKAPEGFGMQDPVAAIKRQVHVSPFYEEGVTDLIDLVGVDRVLFGSDYPHPEGLAEPRHFADMLGHLDEKDQAKIMGGNLAGLLSL
ncbi:amidohydrolase [Rhodococcus sp. ACPA4]|jgi:predicted TIM-barrel fold metal-dependent hydrolase|uniref:Amidohydrolase family protein n=2 Tax=Nocardiaceae TaxID=85025 RepID=A0ABU4BS35_RHOGO|nr:MULTISPECIES: amidohydrolase family protein [Rhodococcus]NMD60226.1 amidohydrolase [Nocardia globerula]KJF23856.1 putative metal-dependent hydrolase of the TIM-barrel fold protein [Rhodococcus sp. AD45]MCE4266431.1 amidohydrolase [Rhodococcus globerulus]MDV6266876.1 amidohydrolase family protein [Rhodococcus globerulus]MDV8069302.1 amidohydrolase family protein [Rhodococcus sp. IEGM 1366]